MTILIHSICAASNNTDLLTHILLLNYLNGFAKLIREIEDILVGKRIEILAFLSTGISERMYMIASSSHSEYR